MIIVKETFALIDPNRRKIGVFTRSDQDHGTKIGQCSILLCGNFDKPSCTTSQDGNIIYNTSVRLHTYAKEISGLFLQARQKTIPIVYFHDKIKNKRYLFLIFELTCDSTLLPLCYYLDNRKGDLFIGMRDFSEAKRGLMKFNKSSFDVDKTILTSLTRKRSPFPIKFSLADKLVEAKLASFTLVKFQVFGP